MKNTIAGIMGKGDLAEQIERGEVEPSELSGLPLVYHKKLEQYREALRSKAVLSEIEKVDTEKIATEKSEDIQKHMGLVPSMQDLKDSQEEIMGPVHEGMIEFRDEVEKKFDDDDEETAAIYFTTILSLADARGARFHGEKLEETRKFAMIDIVTAHIVKEVLKKTDFTLEYTVIGNEPGVDYQEEMQTAIKQVADFWLWRIQKIIGGIVLE